MNACLFKLQHHLWGNLSLLRWLLLGLLALAGSLWMGWLPLPPGGERPGALILLLLAGGLMAAAQRQERLHYVKFLPRPEPPISLAPLPVAVKIAVQASGHFEVEGKAGRFTWLQGFFRTFATREHAVICLATPSRFLLGRQPPEDVGMWYIFLLPKDIRQVHFGEIQFGGDQRPGVAVDYVRHLPKRGRVRPARRVDARVYLACANDAEAARLVADLRWDGITSA